MGNPPGDTNHIMSGSVKIAETALEHTRSNGPLTLTTGTAEISNALDAGAEATSLGAAAAADTAALGGSGEGIAATRLDFGISAGIDAAGDLSFDSENILTTTLGVAGLVFELAGGASCAATTTDSTTVAFGFLAGGATGGSGGGEGGGGGGGGKSLSNCC